MRKARSSVEQATAIHTIKDFSDGSRRVQLPVASTSCCDSFLRSAMITIAGVFFFLSIVPDTAVAAATCTDDVLLAVQLCTPGNFSMGLFIDMRDVQLQCRSGTFEKSLACLTTLASGCQGDQEKRDLLGQYLGLERLRDSWDRLCQGAPLLAEHFECWERTLQASSQCIREEMNNLIRRLQTAFNTSAGVRYADKPLQFVQISCSSTCIPQYTSLFSSLYLLTITETYTKYLGMKVSLLSSSSDVQERRLYDVKMIKWDTSTPSTHTSRGILQCFEPPLRTTCPSEVHSLLLDIYLAYQPPYCGLDQSSAPPGPASPSIAAILISVTLMWFQNLIISWS